MYFTEEDYRKIERWLEEKTVKDSELPVAETLTGTELVPLVQEKENRLVSLYTFKNQLNKMILSDFINVSDMFGDYDLTLWNAVSLVPAESRKPGLVITYHDKCGVWNIVQFKGVAKSQWDNMNLWASLFHDYVDNHIYHPDEEDITGIKDGNRKLLRFKDRKHDDSEFSGKGFKILRKNLRGTRACSIDDEDHYENIIRQSDFPDDNTVYVLRYDYILEEHISIPEGCEIVFAGGTITGGAINLNGCKLVGMVSEEKNYLIDCDVSSWAVGQIEYRDNSVMFWNGTAWVPASGINMDNYYTKQEVSDILENYVEAGDVYTKGEVDNFINQLKEADQHINQELNELREMLENMLTLDDIQRAINAGCGVNILQLPSQNDNKISLPIWTGTQSEYDSLDSKVSGMTYNIIDE